MNENFLKRLEEDQEREMRQLEDKIRKEVSHSFRSSSLIDQDVFALFVGSTKIRS